VNETRAVLLAAILLLGYVWVGYPALLWILRRRLRRPMHRGAQEPRVSIIVAVHNGEDQIEAKLADCLRQEYPPAQLEILVASDHSSDATETLVENFSARDRRIRLLRSVSRVGKSGAQNLAAQDSRGEILFFTDVETRLQPDTLQRLVADFEDPRAGLVTATLMLGPPTSGVARSQSLYWRYELFLREAESDLGILATGSGQAFAMRRELFRPLPPCYGDDCVLPVSVRLQGLRVLHERNAIVFDTMPHTIQGELRARARMTARNWTGTLSQPALLNPFRFPGTAWGLISHKLLRWLTPILLLIVLAANTLLALHGQYITLWVLQAVFYAAASLGWLLTLFDRPAGILAYPFSFCLANVGFFLGLVRGLRSDRIIAY
jgi:cellulose synthase/poly-beta-1,6-N-acetylglucosamine synthase-like glycosyltransferase